MNDYFNSNAWIKTVAYAAGILAIYGLVSAVLDIKGMVT